MKAGASHRAFIGLCLALALRGGMWAETSEHQRLGVRRAPVDSFTADVDLELAFVGLELPTFGLDLGLGASFGGGLFLGLTLPVDFVPRSATGRGPSWTFEDSRPDLSMGFTVRRGPWALSAGADLSCRLAAGPGAGGFELGFAIDAHRFLDPLLLGGGLALSSELPRKDRGGWVSRPLSAAFSLSLTEALNAQVSFSIVLSQSLVGPRLLAGLWESRVWTWTPGFSFRVVVVDGTWALRAGLADPASPRYRCGASCLWRGGQPEGD